MCGCGLNHMTSLHGMAVEHNESPSKASSSSIRSLSSPVSSVTGGLVRKSVLGLPWDAVSAAPCNVKQGLTSEDEKLSVEGRPRGDKSAILLDANKDLMKKGIIELDSGIHGQLPVLSSALQPSQSSPSDSCRSPSPFQMKHECNVHSGDVQVGVLVAGAGRSMRILENNGSPNDGFHPVRHEQESYLDSDTPDTMKTGDSLPYAISPRASESSSLESIATARDAVISDLGAPLCSQGKLPSDTKSDVRGDQLFSLTCIHIALPSYSMYRCLLSISL